MLELKVLPFAAALLACGPTTPTGDGGDAATTPTFTAVQTILNHSCATTLQSCHAPGGSGGLDLSMGNAYASIVGVASVEVPSMPYVTAGDTSNSYLYRKIDNSFLMIPACMAVGNSCGTRMPMVGGAVVSDADLATLRAWITAGAPND